MALQTRRIYVVALADWSVRELDAAIMWIVRYRPRFFPTPGEIAAKSSKTWSRKTGAVPRGATPRRSQPGILTPLHSFHSGRARLSKPSPTNAVRQARKRARLTAHGLVQYSG
jgi:hypothetical protein